MEVLKRSLMRKQPDSSPSPTEEEGKPPGGSEQTHHEGITLKKEIGVLQGVSIIIGAIVGSGIFVSPVGVLRYSNSVGLSFVMWTVTGLFSALGAIVYAELGVTIPRSGGEYIYILKTFGPLPAFLCLWITFVVIGSVSTAANSLIFAQYVLRPFSECDLPGGAVHLVAVIGVATLCAINCYNVKLATKVAVVFTLSKVTAMLIITCIGFYYLFKGNVSNFENPFEDSESSAGAMAMAFYQGFWAFAGWNYLNFLTEEMKNPSRNLPLAIILSLLIVTVIYLLTNVAYLAVLSPVEMLASGEGSAAVAVTFADRTMGVMAWTMPVFVGASVFGSMNGEILSMSRLTFSGAQEGHMPALLAMVSYKYLTPIPAVLIMAILTFIFQLYDNVFYLIELSGFAFAVIAGMAVCSLLYLRWTQPDLPRPFKLPIFVPILFLVLDVFIGTLTVYQKPTESFISLAIMLFGVPIYLVGIAWTKKPEVFVKAFVNFTISVQKCLQVVPTVQPFDEEPTPLSPTPVANQVA